MSEQIGDGPTDCELNHSWCDECGHCPECAQAELDAKREVTDAEIDAAAIVLFAEWQQFGEYRSWEKLDHFERGSFRSTAAKMFEAAREVKQ